MIILSNAKKLNKKAVFLFEKAKKLGEIVKSMISTIEELKIEKGWIGKDQDMFEKMSKNYVLNLKRIEASLIDYSDLFSLVKRDHEKVNIEYTTKQKEIEKDGFQV